jgi:GxxExxY protein
MERAPALTMEEQLDPLTNRIIGCAITLHRFLGPGLLESVYRNGLAIEMGFAGIAFNRERCIDVTYRGIKLGEFHPDFIVEDAVVVEVKSVSAHDRVFDAQVLTYLRVTGLRTGLLLNFGRPVLKDGIKRFVL